jgi:hypothetical protein
LGASGLIAGATSLWVASTDWTEAPTTPDLPPARPLRQAAALEVPSLTDGLTTSVTFSDDRTPTPIELIGAVR